MIVALISGIVSTFSVIVIAYREIGGGGGCRCCGRRFHISSRNGKPWFRYVANIILSLVAICLSILATGLGPVAVATPIQVGSNLLSNMCLQWFLGMIRPTKDQLVGTMTLAAAVTILPDIGPGEMELHADVLYLLGQPSALLYIAVSSVMMASGMLALAKGWVKENDSKLLTFAMVGGTATVVSASIGKAVQMIHNLIVLGPLLVIYVGLGALCLGVAARANATLEDPSSYVSIASGVQLVCTCFAGLFIWGDSGRLEYPLGYSMIYVLVVLGTYGVSSFDLLAAHHVGFYAEEMYSYANASLQNLNTLDDEDNSYRKHYTGPKGDIIRNEIWKLVGLWQSGSTDEAEYRKVLQLCLDKLLLTRRLKGEDVVELVLDLLQDNRGFGPEPAPAFKNWLEKHVKSYVDMSDGAYADEHASPLLRTAKWNTMPNLLQTERRLIRHNSVM